MPDATNREVESRVRVQEVGNTPLDDNPDSAAQPRSPQEADPPNWDAATTPTLHEEQRLTPELGEDLTRLYRGVISEALETIRAGGVDRLLTTARDRIRASESALCQQHGLVAGTEDGVHRGVEESRKNFFLERLFELAGTLHPFYLDAIADARYNVLLRSIHSVLEASRAHSLQPHQQIELLRTGRAEPGIAADVDGVVINRHCLPNIPALVGATLVFELAHRSDDREAFLRNLSNGLLLKRKYEPRPPGPRKERPKTPGQLAALEIRSRFAGVLLEQPVELLGLIRQAASVFLVRPSRPDTVDPATGDLISNRDLLRDLGKHRTIRSGAYCINPRNPEALDILDAFAGSPLTEAPFHEILNDLRVSILRASERYGISYTDLPSALKIRHTDFEVLVKQVSRYAYNQLLFKGAHMLALFEHQQGPDGLPDFSVEASLAKRIGYSARCLSRSREMIITGPTGAKERCSVNASMKRSEEYRGQAAAVLYRHFSEEFDAAIATLSAEDASAEG